jgi:hypothetical protein
MVIDVGCGAFVGSRSRGTCQLLVGHDSEHATVLVVGGIRILRRWASPLAVDDAEFDALVAASLPWAPGRPSVAPSRAPARKLTLVSKDRPDESVA